MPDPIKYTSHRLNAQDRHIARIEALFGEDFESLLRQRYLVEGVTSRRLADEWGMTFRMFRSLCERFDIPMRSISEAVLPTWTSERRAAEAAKLKRTMARFDFSGDRNPAKRPEVRAKISAAKKADNAASRPEVRAKLSAIHRARFAADPKQHINYRMAKSHRRSKIERLMQDALQRAGVVAEHGHRVGRRWPDLVIPEARLIIECDGVQWHTDSAADAARDEELRQAGWQVLHFTDERIVPDADACAAEVVAWLQARGLDPATLGQQGMLRRHEQIPLL